MLTTRQTKATDQINNIYWSIHDIYVKKITIGSGALVVMNII